MSDVMQKLENDSWLSLPVNWDLVNSKRPGISVGRHVDHRGIGSVVEDGVELCTTYCEAEDGKLAHAHRIAEALRQMKERQS